MKVLGSTFFLLNPTSEHTPQGLAGSCCWSPGASGQRRWACGWSCTGLLVTSLAALWSQQPSMYYWNLIVCSSACSPLQRDPVHSWGFPVIGEGMAGPGGVVPWLGLVHFSVKRWPVIPSNCRLCGAAGSSVDGGAAVFCWQCAHRAGRCGQGQDPGSWVCSAPLSPLPPTLHALTDLGLSFRPNLLEPLLLLGLGPTPASCAVQQVWVRVCRAGPVLWTGADLPWRD